MAETEIITALEARLRIKNLFDKWFRKQISYGHILNSIKLMLEISDSEALKLLSGITNVLTEDKIFILPYLFNATESEREDFYRYAKIVSSADNKDLLADLDPNQFTIAIHFWQRGHRNDVELTPEQVAKIIKIVLQG